MTVLVFGAHEWFISPYSGHTPAASRVRPRQVMPGRVRAGQAGSGQAASWTLAGRVCVGRVHAGRQGCVRLRGQQQQSHGPARPRLAWPGMTRPSPMTSSCCSLRSVVAPTSVVSPHALRITTADSSSVDSGVSPRAAGGRRSVTCSRGIEHEAGDGGQAYARACTCVYTNPAGVRAWPSSGALKQASKVCCMACTNTHGMHSSAPCICLGMHGQRVRAAAAGPPGPSHPHLPVQRMQRWARRRRPAGAPRSPCPWPWPARPTSAAASPAGIGFGVAPQQRHGFRANTQGRCRSGRMGGMGHLRALHPWAATQQKLTHTHTIS